MLIRNFCFLRVRLLLIDETFGNHSGYHGANIHHCLFTRSSSHPHEISCRAEISWYTVEVTRKTFGVRECSEILCDATLCFTCSKCRGRWHRVNIRRNRFYFFAQTFGWECFLAKLRRRPQCRRCHNQPGRRDARRSGRHHVFRQLGGKPL